MKLIKKTAKKDKHGRYIYIFECERCEAQVENDLSNGRRNKTCGCQLLDHKDIKSKRLYECWVNMKTRCGNKNNAKWPRYGGRGISVCDEWKSFLPFQTWAYENGYDEALTIDRIDNDGNYEPENCQWLSIKDNCRKTSRTKITTQIAWSIREISKAGGRTDAEVANMFGCHYKTVYNVRNGIQWS